MNYFVYVEEILGVKINADKFNWIYGGVAPKTNKIGFEKCKIKVSIELKKSKNVFDKSLNQNDYDKYNYFFAKRNEKKIYYERKFFFNSRLRFSIEVKDNNNIEVIASTNYYKNIKHRVMNLHSIEYILADLVSGILLKHGYSTIYCSSVNIGNNTLVIFAPPNTGKTLTAIRLCELVGAKFIAEDIALTDGKNIYSAPWTSTFRYYSHNKESIFSKLANTLKNNIPVFQLFIPKNRKTMNDYLGEDIILSKSVITDVIVLSKGNDQVLKSKDTIFENLINLNKYEFNYHRSPSVLVLNYFNSEFSPDDMFNAEKSILNKLLNNSDTYRINANNPLDYSKLIIDKIISNNIKD